MISREDNRANPALDIWSMGCILYYLLTNACPFMAPDESRVVNNILNVKYPKLPASVSAPWHVLIRGMLRKDPTRRWDLLRISEHILKHRQSSDAPLTEESEEEKEERKEVPKRKRGNPGAPAPGRAPAAQSNLSSSPAKPKPSRSPYKGK